MLTWADVLPIYRLMRQHKAWCPICYEEWRASEQVIYDPLIWFLEVIKICPCHQQLLSFQCPSCNKYLPTLRTRARPGFCPRCGAWLGSLSGASSLGESLNSDDFSWQNWVVKTVGDLLAVGPSLAEPPTRDTLAKNVSLLIEEFTGGDVSAYVRILKAGGVERIDVPRIWLYQQGQILIKFDIVLQICYFLGISPIHLFTKIVTPMILPENVIDFIKLETNKSKEKKKYPDDDSLRSSLKEYLQSKKTPPPSLTWIASQLGRSSGYLKRHFPEESQAIVQKYQSYWENKWRELKKSLQSVLENNELPPPSVAEVARRLQYNLGDLTVRFSELCKKISKRYQDYQHAQKIERIQRRCEEIRKVAFEIYAEGEYPGYKRIIERLLVGRLSSEELMAWRAALEELGLRQSRPLNRE